MSKTKRFVISSTLAIMATLAQSASISASAKTVLNGEVCSANVHKLTSEITWYKSLGKAEDAAGKEGKLIVWVHMLGKIDGST
ncbi:MAG: hypothetical protein WC714_04355 [Candidatus Obscuribacterales bacterium]